MLHYSDNFKISNYKIAMERLKKIEELKLKITEIKDYLEDLAEAQNAKKNKIFKLEKEINDMKNGMSRYLDEIENLIDEG